jgi:hypothetical protein
MKPISVTVEVGKKRAFADAVEWPGWCRRGRDEAEALQALVDYGPRYAHVLESAGIEFVAPIHTSELHVIEQHAGNSTTDFGAPAIVLEADRAPIDGEELKRLRAILLACWQTFDETVYLATGRELRKGPRGGGRNLVKIVNHVLEADQAYLSRVAWRHKKRGGKDLVEEFIRTRQAVLDALQVAARGDLPERGPRGGVIWPPRYFVRRVAWHVLDHAWEIEDRVV